MTTIKYKQGQERGPFLERNDFEDSIFYNQYVQAFNLLDKFLEKDNQKDESLKCVAFCGDRGEGKTSCMSSVLEIIAHYSDNNSAAKRFISSLNCDNIPNLKPAIIDIIDPSFFNESKNVLEIIIGQLYNTFKENTDNDRIDLRNKVYHAFNEVSTTLMEISNSDVDSLNNLHALSILAANIQLQKKLAFLVDAYLKYVESDYLIIPVDDIDLDVVYAYRMCEQIRKYLCVPRCFVLISFKIEQLQDVVAQAMKCAIGTPGSSFTFFPDEKIVEMAKKYLNKLIPVTSRVEMPKAYNLADIAVEIPMGNTTVTFESLKKAIVELIFNRTRYLFYNSFDGVSPIVPNNLRDIINLLGLLCAMQEIPNSRDPKKQTAFTTNKHLFKYFFFNVWRKRFFEGIQKELDDLINFDFGTSFNRQIIILLDKYFDDYLKKDYNYQNNEDDKTPSSLTEIEFARERNPRTRQAYLVSGGISPTARMLNSITSYENFGYNISIGDVFYIFSFLERETLSEPEFALIFFLKSLYSIKLYEAYDFITGDINRIYPENNTKIAGLSIIDHRFDCSNKLQQLTGGSYFTYCPGDLIPRAEGLYDLDLRIIDATPLNTLLSELKKEYSEVKKLMEGNYEITPENETDELAEKKNNEENIRQNQISTFFDRLNIAEFFILTIQCSVYKRYFLSEKSKSEVVGALYNMRKNVNPFHYTSFNNKTGFYLFDITAPFGNLINPEYAYKRFETIDNDFFQFIRNSKFSLLYKIISVCSKNRAYIDHKTDAEWTQIHRLLSDCIIRNAEVLSSMKNNMVIRRSKNNELGWDKFFSFYGNLNSSELDTQPTSHSTEPDKIAFNFLEPLDQLLKTVNTPDDQKNEMSKLFLSIFDSRIEKDNAEPGKAGSLVKSKGKEQKLSLSDLLQTIKNYRNPNSIRTKLRDLLYFSDYTDDMLMTVLPDKADKSNYTYEEVKICLTNWYIKNFN